MEEKIEAGTKERILTESLTLFAQKGFEGVSVREIAKAVGVRESALYKHYKNKQEIMDCILSETKQRAAAARKKYQIPEIETDDLSGIYEKLSVEKIGDMAWGLFQFYTKDPVVSCYRKLLMREQFNNPTAAGQYSGQYLYGAVKNQASIFSELVRGGLFRKEDPEIIALHFYAPIFLLFQQYDCHPEQEAEIKEKVYQHVRVFGECYR